MRIFLVLVLFSVLGISLFSSQTMFRKNDKEHDYYVQYSQMYDKTTEGFKGLAKFNLRFSLFFCSIFLGDYIKLFPTTLEVFERNNELKFLTRSHIVNTNTFTFSVNIFILQSAPR